MRHKTTCLALLIVLSVFFLPAAAAKKNKDAPPDGLTLMPHLPHDPVLVWVQTVEDPGQSFDDMLGWIGRFSEQGDSSEIRSKLEEADAKLGFSLRNDLLANLGPEFAVAIDFPPIDQAAAALGNPQQGLETLLGRAGLVFAVREEEIIDRCLRRLVELAEGRVSQAGNLVRVELGPEEKQNQPGELPVPTWFYGFRGAVLAMGASDAWVRDALDADAGLSLGSGEDFKRVFSHLDASPKTLTYVNLPKLREMIESSAMLGAIIEADAEAKKAAEMFLTPDFVGVGLGATSVEVDGGVRTTTYGPAVFGGGSLAPGIIAAIAIPNFLNAVDKGKQKRTMADIRSVGTACEAFSIDNERYPGPTEGWVELDAVASALEPVYIRTLPRVDGWGQPLLYWSDGTSYRIVSRGKDGAEDRDWSQADLDSPTRTQGADRDIVFADGSFAVHPEED